MKKALFIVCAFDEGVKLQSVAERIHGFLQTQSALVPTEILFVDDASTDGMPRALSQKFGFHYLRNDTRMGIGFSIRRAYEFGRENHFDILVVMAGNNKDNPDEFNRVIKPIVQDRADFVQGSRYLKGGGFGNMPIYRLLSTRVVHPFFFWLASGRWMTDTTNGYRAVRSSLLNDQRINLYQDWLNHYELEPYLFCKAVRLKYRVQEVPVSKIYPDKALGYSKMKPITGWWSILRPLFRAMMNKD